MAEKKAAQVRLQLFLFLSSDRDSQVFRTQQHPSASTSAGTCSTTFSPLYDPLSVEEEAQALAQVTALRELSTLLDRELPTVCVKEASQSKAIVQLGSPIDSPFSRRRAKMRLSERSAGLRIINQ